MAMSGSRTLACLLREHRSEWTRVEHDADVRDLLALDLIPFANKCGPGGRVGHHVVKDAYIVAIGENLFHIDSLNDGMQFFQRLEIWLGAIKSVNGALERQIVVHEFPGSGKVPFAQRLLIVAHELACISHRYPPTLRTFEKCKIDRPPQLFSQEIGFANPVPPRTKMAHTSLLGLFEVQWDSASPEALARSPSLDSSERRRRR